jgi:hypothetical protein
LKLKVSFIIFAIITLALIVSVVYYQVNYKTLEDAINETNVPIDDVYHTTERKGHTIIFYGQDDILSVGFIEKTFLGYRWVIGTGSKSFNVGDQILTRSVNGLRPRDTESEQELISLSFGVLNDDSINKLMIKYKDQDIAEATIIETKKGRIWYCFSDTPVGYDPEVIRIDKDGNEITGWY